MGFFVCLFVPLSLTPFHSLRPVCSPVSCFCSSLFLSLSYLVYLTCLVPFHSSTYFPPGMLSLFFFTVSISLCRHVRILLSLKQSFRLLSSSLCRASPHGYGYLTFDICVKRFVFPRSVILHSFTVSENGTPFFWLSGQEPWRHS